MYMKFFNTVRFQCTVKHINHKTQIIFHVCCLKFQIKISEKFINYKNLTPLLYTRQHLRIYDFLFYCSIQTQSSTQNTAFFFSSNFQYFTRNLCSMFTPIKKKIYEIKKHKIHAFLYIFYILSGQHIKCR